MDLFISNNTTKLVGTLLVVLVLWVFHRIIVFFVRKHFDKPRLRSVWTQTSRYVMLAAGILILIQLWFESLAAIFTVLSLIAAALTIVNKEALLNFTGWLVIIWRGLFVIGDRVAIKGHTGDVLNAGLQYFTLAEIDTTNVSQNNTTGRIVKIPNSSVLTESIVNFNQGFAYIWHEVVVPITIDSDWHKAETLLLDIIKSQHHTLTEKEIDDIKNSDLGVAYRSFDPSVVVRVTDGHILLVARYICKPYRESETADAIWRAVLETFEQQTSITMHKA